jgi:hypothetical protein
MSDADSVTVARIRALRVRWQSHARQYEGKTALGVAVLAAVQTAIDDLTVALGDSPQHPDLQRVREMRINERARCIADHLEQHDTVVKHEGYVLCQCGERFHDVD